MKLKTKKKPKTKKQIRRILALIQCKVDLAIVVSLAFAEFADLTFG